MNSPRRHAVRVISRRVQTDGLRAGRGAHPAMETSEVCPEGREGVETWRQRERSRNQCEQVR